MAVPKQFDGPALGVLRAALIDAFPDPFVLAPFLRDRLNRALFNYAPPFGDYSDQVFRLLDRANAQAWVAELVAAALEAVPNNPRLREFGTAHGFTAVTEPELVLAHERTVQAGIDFLDLAVWRSRLGEIEGRVARIEIALDQGGYSYGTGFLVGPSVLITNYHVLEPVYLGLEGKTTEEGYSAAPAAVTIRFDYKRLPEGVLNEGVTYGLAANWNLDRSDSFYPVEADPPGDRLDYGLIRLSEPAGSHPVGKKAATTGSPRGFMVPRVPYPFAPSSPVIIAQHPEADPLKLAIATDGMIGSTPGQTRVRYRTNTETGSSGSPVLTQNLELIALHHAGDPNHERVAEWNQGIPFGAILALMGQRGTRQLLGT